MVNPLRILFRGGRVSSPADPTATALLVQGDRIGWLGPDADAPAADEVVDLDGALVTPAFVDAHVHATDTGLMLTGLRLSGLRHKGELLAAVAARASGLASDAVVLGHGWDETTWADGSLPGLAELDRAAGGRAVYLSRACVHAALVSSPLAALVGAGGADGAVVRREEHHVVRAAALGSVGAVQRREAQEAALRRAAELGVAAVHECGGPGTSSEEDFVGLLALEGLPEVYGYWGELGAAAKARELGAQGAGGDLFADGSLGARTAHVRSPYVDEETTGTGYLRAEQVAAHLVGCVREGVQGGFHAIGDAALETVLEGFAGAAARVGVERLRSGRHRIEHAELLDKALIGRLVEFGVVASVQPAFDRLWGGPAAMYAQRLGVERALASNPIGALAGVGVGLAFGSDSPVTDLDPWGTVRAAVEHHNPVQRLSVRQAFAAHTRGGWRAVRRDAEGVLNPGWPATFAVWSVPGGLDGALPRLDGQLPVALRTVVRGTTIFRR
jgi:predicted amidohydrolase YtcJ